MTKIATFLMKLIPAETIASIAAEHVTKALSKIENQDKLAAISSAVSASSAAVSKLSDAIKDGKLTQDEVVMISTNLETAVALIIEAAK